MIIIKNASIRKLFRIIVPFFIIPFSIIFSLFFSATDNHYMVSIIVVFLSLLYFISGIEQKNIGTRRMVIVAIMIALCVTGRFIPFFQPITAITVITAIYLGPESGFLTGAMAAFISNFYFGQGPWTPFQMLAWGLIGLVAGYLSKFLLKSKLLLTFYGVLSGIAYSLIMDVWSTLMYNGIFSIELYITSVVTAFPHTVMYSVSNFIFLYLFSVPLGKKLSRIKIKYGI